MHLRTLSAGSATLPLAALTTQAPYTVLRGACDPLYSRMKLLMFVFLTNALDLRHVTQMCAHKILYFLDYCDKIKTILVCFPSIIVIYQSFVNCEHVWIVSENASYYIFTMTRNILNLTFENDFLLESKSVC
jgi:hypothetical protein